MKKFVLRLAALLGCIVLLLMVALLIISPQETKSFIEQDGGIAENSIAEIRDVEINGVTQRLLIRGLNRNNPLLLHVHGGPGGADQAIVRSSQLQLEDLFTVVYWDQRGAGASYSNSMPMESLSLSQIVTDGVELSKALLTEFSQEKLYLQGHSWGTFVGVHMIAEAPELFHAYFGIGQVANSKKAESLSYQFTIDSATQAGDQTTIEKLKELTPPPYNSEELWLKAVMIERALMRPFENPNEKQFLSMPEIYKTFVFYPEYSIKDKLNSLIGSEKSIQKLWIEVIDANLFESLPSLAVPVYIFQGKYDQHTVTSVAKEYYDLLQAPYKEYHSFDNSAHWPHLKEHEKYRSILRGIISK